MRPISHPQIPIHELFREPGERLRYVTVIQSEGFLPQKKIWLSPHRKNYYILMVLTKGSGRNWIDMVPYEYNDNSVFFSSPEQVHVKEDVKASGTVICITKEFFAMEQNTDLLNLPFIQNIKLGNELNMAHCDRAELKHILDHIVTEYRETADLQDEMLYSYLRILLLFLGRFYNKKYANAELGQHHAIYLRFQAVIEDNYKKIHNVKSYADILHISVSYLNSLIKEHSGKSVLIHVHNRQILEAKRLLFNTGMSVKEIAFGLNFHDSSYFNRFFKKYTSVTPMEYRAGISEKSCNLVC